MTADRALKCWGCGVADVEVTKMNVGSDVVVHCPRCLDYVIKMEAMDELEAHPNVKVSAWIRSRQDPGNRPIVSGETLKRMVLPDYTVGEKQLLLLKYLEEHTTPGQPTELKPHRDFPVTWSVDHVEFRFLTKVMEERELIFHHGPKPMSGELRMIIGAKGWDTLEQAARTSVLSEQAFVAMSFHPDLTPLWEQGFIPAIEAAGFRPHRVDSTPHADRIDVKIMADIKQSRFVLADVTGQRQGVYFEAGYALGLGLNVIWSVKEEEKDKVHFDTKQYNHIRWTDPADLAKQLLPFIIAIIGQGPRKK